MFLFQNAVVSDFLPQQSLFLSTLSPLISTTFTQQASKKCKVLFTNRAAAKGTRNFDVLEAFVDYSHDRHQGQQHCMQAILSC